MCARVLKFPFNVSISDLSPVMCICRNNVSVTQCMLPNQTVAVCLLTDSLCCVQAGHSSGVLVATANL